MNHLTGKIVPKKESSDTLRNTLRLWTLVMLEGLAAAVWLLLIPKEAGNAEFLGYSFRRLALLTPIFGLALAAGLLRLGFQKRADWQAALADEIRRARLARAGIVIGFLMALAAWAFAFFFHFLRLLDDIGAYVRLLPVLAYALAAGLECLLFSAFSWLRSEKKAAGFKLRSLFGRGFWITIAILVAIWLAIEATGLGKAPEFISIISLGVPLLEGQICSRLVWVLDFVSGGCLGAAA
jgi:hypothetical protein